METSAWAVDSFGQGLPRRTSDLSGSDFDVGLASGELANLQTAEGALVENLSWIKSNQCVLALEEHLEKTIALFETRVYRNRTQIRKRQHEILQLFGLWSGFQAVLLLCVASSNFLQCRNLWTPFSLSALASITIFCGVFQKYKIIGSLDDTLASEGQALKVAVTRIYELRRDGPKYFDSCNRRANSHQFEPLNQWARPAVVDVFVVLPLVLFSVIILASFWHMLCTS